MNANSRNARRIITARRDAAKSHRVGLHTLAGHARLAGLDADTASAVGGALRGKSKACGITGETARMVRKMEAEIRFVRNARRYSRAEVATLAAAYAPRLNRYKAAKVAVLAYASV